MANAYRVYDSFAALGDPTRRRIFERVASQPSSVVDLARRLPVSRPAVSQHLRVLKEARLVCDSREGTRRIYRLDPRGLAAMREWLDSQWVVALEAFREFANEQADRDSQR